MVTLSVTTPLALAAVFGCTVTSEVGALPDDIELQAECYEYPTPARFITLPMANCPMGPTALFSGNHPRVILIYSVMGLLTTRRKTYRLLAALDFPFASVYDRAAATVKLTSGILTVSRQRSTSNVSIEGDIIFNNADQTIESNSSLFLQENTHITDGRGKEKRILDREYWM